MAALGKIAIISNSTEQGTAAGIAADAGSFAPISLQPRAVSQSMFHSV